MTRFDPYQAATDAILEAIAAGCVPWRSPWRLGVGDDGLNRSFASRRAYRGVNVPLLDATVMVRGYSCRQWATFCQVRDAGGHVRAGEHGSRVFFWKFFDTDRDAVDGTPKRIPMLRCFTVFNIDQCEGIQPRDALEVPAFDPIERAESIVSGMPLRPALFHGGDRAFYRLDSDSVQMPHGGAFHSREGYYQTLFHELAHSTGHESRVTRKTLGETAPFGSADYSREELVAELSSAMVMRAAQIECDIPASAAYIANWHSRLRDDPKVFVWAAGQAQKAADWILDRRADEGTGL